MFHAMQSIGYAQEVDIHPSHVIRPRAEQLELEEAKKIEILPTNFFYLSILFDEVYTMLLPSREDYETRKTLIAFVEKFARQNIRGSSFNKSGPSVSAFGSYTMDLFTSNSDLDLSVNLGYPGDVLPRENKIQVLKKLTRTLRGLQGGGRIRGVLPILRAIVPVLKFVDCQTGIECDISIENKDGILKSELLRIFSSIDRRFAKLCYLMKAWAKAHDINSSKDRTLNSLSIILLVAFHLQTRSPPILPPFSVFLEGLCFGPDGHDIMEVEKRVLQYKDFGNRNMECIPELFVSLLCKLSSVQSLWEVGLCASTYEGVWISKKLENRVGCINVEDFTIRTQNAARAVAKKECETIYKCIRETLSRLQKPLASQSEASDLKLFLFGSPSELKNTLGQLHKVDQQHIGKRNMPFEQMTSQKRMRFLENERIRESAVGKLPMRSSEVESINFVPRSLASPVPGYSQSKEQAWGVRWSQGQDPKPVPRYAQVPALQPGVTYSQWQDTRDGPRYEQRHGLVHEVSHMTPLEARLVNSYQRGPVHEPLYSTSLEARFINPYQSGLARGLVHAAAHLTPLETRYVNSYQNGVMHEASHLNPLKAGYVNSYQSGPVHEVSHLTSLEAKLVRQNNWSLNRQIRF